MKKLVSLLALFAITLSLGACSNETTQEVEQSVETPQTVETSQSAEASDVEAETGASEEKTETVDGFTSASNTKTVLTGEAYDSAVEKLVAVSSDLASLATTQEEGYTAPESANHVQILTVNEDGTVGFSTIAAWQFQKNENGTDQVLVQLTDGQNARNLLEVGARGSIIVHDDLYYILHLNVTNVEELPYTEENYANGLFNYAYTGADHQASQFNITFDVLYVESTPVALLD